MRRGGGFRILGALVLVGSLAAVTAGAYGAGYSAAGGTGPTPWGAGVAHGFAWGGFHIFGFLFTVLMLVVVFAIVRAVIWGHPHRHWDHFGPGDQGGPEGPGGWQGGPGWHGMHGMHGMHGDRWHSRQAFLDEWHRQAHSGPSQSGEPGSTGPTAGSGPAGA